MEEREVEERGVKDRRSRGEGSKGKGSKGEGSRVGWRSASEEREELELGRGSKGWNKGDSRGRKDK